MTIRSRLVLAALFLIGSASIACQAHAQEPTIRLNDYPGIGNPMARTIVDGKLCEKHGFKCTLVKIPAAPLAMQALLAGSVEVAAVSTDSGLLAVQKGAKLRILGASLVTTNFFLAVANHLGPERTRQKYPEVVKSLKGMKIGVAARGSPAEYQFVALATGAGLKASDFTMVAVGGPDTAYAALTHNQIDALLGFEPVAAMCSVTATCVIAVDMRKGEGPAELTALNGASAANFVRADYAQANPRIMAGLAAAFAEAEKAYLNPSQVASLVAVTEKYFPMGHPKGKEILTGAIESTRPAVRFQIDPAALQAISEFMVRTGQIPAPANTSELLLRGLKAVKGE